MRLLPILAFVMVALVVAYLWKERVEAPTMVGQVVGRQAEVRSPQSGSLTDMSLSDFDSVSAGDPVGRLITTDPKIVEAELAVVLAEIQLVRLSMDPFADMQRNLLNYESMHMDLMENRARLGIARIRKQQAEREFSRVQHLHEEGLTSDEIRDRAESRYLSLKEEVAIIRNLVNRLADRLDNIDLEDVFAVWKEQDPAAAAIEVHQRTIEKIKAEMMPVVLQAPASGQVAHIQKMNGEYVEQGDVLFYIHSPRPDYILGHLRHPFFIEPEPGMEVLVRKQSRDRESAVMKIAEVGVQMETIGQMTTLFPDQQFETVGLPVRIAISHKLDLMPGEVVDIRLITR